MAEHNAAFLARMGSTQPGPHNRPPHNAMHRYHNDPHFEPAVPKAEVRIGFLLPNDPDHPRMIVTEAGVERWQADYRSGDVGISLPSIDAYPLPKALRERLKRGHLVSGMGIDAMDGVISLKNGRLDIDDRRCAGHIPAQPIVGSTVALQVAIDD